MKEIKHHQPSNFSWNDLLTSDADSAKKFYGELFGYTAVDTPAGTDMVYTMLNLQNKAAAALYQMSPEMGMGDMPSHWIPYFSVEDCDESLKKAQEVGATVNQSATDIPGTGRFSVLQDPQGAVFAILKMEPMEEQ